MVQRGGTGTVGCLGARSVVARGRRPSRALVRAHARPRDVDLLPKNATVSLEYSKTPHRLVIQTLHRVHSVQVSAKGACASLVDRERNAISTLIHIYIRKNATGQRETRAFRDAKGFKRSAKNHAPPDRRDTQDRQQGGGPVSLSLSRGRIVYIQYIPTIDRLLR